jgi:hypothetical protein
VGTSLAGIAGGVTLNLHNVTTPEAHVATPAALMLALGAATLYRNRQASSVVLVPGLALALLPTFALAMNDDHGRQAVALVAATVVICLGAELRLATPLAVGAGMIGLLSLRVVGPQLAQMPHWIAWAAAGTILLTLGATWEARLEDVRRIRGALLPRIIALR